MGDALNTIIIKNGIDTSIEVEDRGSLLIKETTNPTTTNNNEIHIVDIIPYLIGKVLPPDLESPFISGMLVNKETAEKDNKYGAID